MMLKLFHNDMSVCAQKVRMVLCAKHLDWDSEHLNLRAGDQHKPEFLSINPKAVVPVLVHGENTITESSVIVEYLEDAFPDVPLFPSDPASKASARRWLLALDAGLHTHIATISFCCAFRYQVLEKYPHEAALNAFISKTPDPMRRAHLAEMLFKGGDCQSLSFAVAAYNTLLGNLSDVLKRQNFMVGDDITAADIGFLPYIERLQQLGCSPWWSDRPEIDAWLDRLRETRFYAEGTEKWKNPGYLKLMSSLGEQSWAMLSKLI